MSIARTLACTFSFLVIGLCLNSQSAECKSQVHIRKKFIPKPHDWKSVGRVAILPIEHHYGTGAASKSRNRSSQGRDFPSDSALRPLLGEMGRQIQTLDPSIVVFTVGKTVTDLPESQFVKVVGNISRADVVLSVHVTEVDYTEATAEMPGGFAGGAQLPPIESKPASTRARMTFALKDVKYGDIIWQIEANGKETADSAGESSTQAGPHSLESLLKEMIIAAGSRLPFGEVPAE